MAFYVPGLLARLPRDQKIYWPRFNPFENYNDKQFLKRFRFDRNGVIEICDMVRDNMEPDTSFGGAIPLEIRVCAALRYYATVGSLQLGVGDMFGISQSSVCRFVWDFSYSFVRHLNNVITFPEGVLVDQQRENFFNVTQIPNVLGAIDCTHVLIQKPSEFPHSFVNRKGWPSINVQAVCDFEGRFINIYAKWPGATHDSFILRQSELFQRFEMGHINGRLLGDSGYPLKPWLMVPFAVPTNGPQENFNEGLRRGRVKIEQAFGICKKRFLCLRSELKVHPSKACLMIVCAAMLNNLATQRNLPILYAPEDVDAAAAAEEVYPQQPYFHPDAALADVGLGALSGLAMRQHIVEQFF